MGVEFTLDLDADDALNQVVKLGGGLDELIDDFKRLDKATNKLGLDKQLRGSKGRFVAMGKSGTKAFGDIGAAAKGSLTGGIAKGFILGTVITGIASLAKDAAFALVRLGVQAAAAFTKMVLTASVFRERMQFAFKTLTRGASDGTKELAKMRKLAIEFGTDFEETTTSILRLQKLGFGAKEAEELFKATQDLKTVGATADELKRVMLAISQIKATGKLQGDELLQLAEAGVDLNAVYKALAKNLGKTVPEIMKLKEAGKIDSATGIKAIKEAIAETTGAKFAGEKGKEFADNTVTGMIARIKAMSGVMKDVFAESLGPAFLELKPILDDIMEALQSEDAKAAVQAIAAAVGAIFKGAVKAWPIIKAFLGGFLEEGKKIWEVVKQIGASISEAFGGEGEVSMEDLIGAARVLGRVFAWVIVIIGIFIGVIAVVVGIVGGIVAAILAIPVAILAALGAIGVLAGELAGKAVALGTAIVNGIKNGITNGANTVIAALKGLATRALNAAKSALGVASPSKEFQWVGEMVGEGFAGGVDTTAPTATASMQDMVSPDSLNLTGQGQGGGSGATFSATFNFAPGTTKDDASAIGDEIERRVEGILERHALEAGL